MILSCLKLLKKIISLSTYTLTTQAQKNFSPDDSYFSKNLVKLFERLIKKFSTVASLIEGFNEYLARPKKYAALLENHFFYNKSGAIQEINKDSNPNFYYLEDTEKKSHL
jgi:hypothetical protein